MLKTHKFARKPFYVDAIRVSENNIEEVATWCGGTVKEDTTGAKHISVQVHRPINERQTQAYYGDWVLQAGGGFKVYTPRAFDKSFEKVKTLTKEQADVAGIKPPHEPRTPTNPVGPKGPSPASVAARVRVTQRGGDELSIDEQQAEYAAAAAKREEEQERLGVMALGVEAPVDTDKAVAEMTFMDAVPVENTDSGPMAGFLDAIPIASVEPLSQNETPEDVAAEAMIKEILRG